MHALSSIYRHFPPRFQQDLDTALVHGTFEDHSTYDISASAVQTRRVPLALCMCDGIWVLVMGCSEDVSRFLQPDMRRWVMSARVAAWGYCLVANTTMRLTTCQVTKPFFLDGLAFRLFSNQIQICIILQWRTSSSLHLPLTLLQVLDNSNIATNCSNWGILVFIWNNRPSWDADEHVNYLPIAAKKQKTKGRKVWYHWACKASHGCVRGIDVERFKVQLSLPEPLRVTTNDLPLKH